jgi:hypothetical protein
MTFRPALLAILLLAACGQAPLRLSVPPAAPAERIPVSLDTVEVLDVSLPDYATDDRIFRQGQGGALSPVPRAIWADDPARAITLDLARLLAETTGATVAPEPWPFEEEPAAQVDVRVAEIVANEAGAFLMRGQYFVASRDGSGRDTASEFRISVPLAPSQGPAAIAAARAQATVLLAREIASEGLR